MADVFGKPWYLGLSYCVLGKPYFCVGGRVSKFRNIGGRSQTMWTLFDRFSDPPPPLWDRCGQITVPPPGAATECGESRLDPENVVTNLVKINDVLTELWVRPGPRNKIVRGR